MRTKIVVKLIFVCCIENETICARWCYWWSVFASNQIEQISLIKKCKVIFLSFFKHFCKQMARLFSVVSSTLAKSNLNDPISRSSKSETNQNENNENAITIIGCVNNASTRARNTQQSVMILNCRMYGFILSLSVIITNNNLLLERLLLCIRWYLLISGVCVQARARFYFALLMFILWLSLSCAASVVEFLFVLLLLYGHWYVVDDTSIPKSTNWLAVHRWYDFQTTQRPSPQMTYAHWFE